MCIRDSETIIEVCAAQLLGLKNNQPGAEDFTSTYAEEDINAF